MKKLCLFIVFMMFITVCFTACGSESENDSGAGSTEASKAASEAGETKEADETKQDTSAEKTELVIFAAASMTETLEEIKDLYAAVDPNVTLTFNFDSSGTLKTQIEEGAECDVFISAAQKQMDELKELELLSDDTRLDLLENRVALVVPADNPKDINDFDDMAQKLKDGDILLAMGNSDVPVGQYTQKILEFYSIDEESVNSNISYGSNVKEVTTQVSENSVDCGVVYATDAFSAGLDVKEYATEEMCGKVIYPIAVTKNTKYKDAAQAFLDFLTSDEAFAVFEKVGFSKV